jgi:hypothetical protein
VNAHQPLAHEVLPVHGKPDTFVVVSARSGASYLVTPAGCDCKGFRFTERCSHVTAVVDHLRTRGKIGQDATSGQVADDAGTPPVGAR